MRFFSDKNGFTLMEMVVALGIFSIGVVAATSIMVRSNRIQSRIITSDRTQSEMRRILDAMAQQVRDDSIDYSYYQSRFGGAGINRPDTTLALRDASNNAFQYRLSVPGEEGLCPDAQSAPCVLYVTNSTTTAISPKGTNISGLSFYISPTSDPFTVNPVTGVYDNNLQPRVTIVFTLTSLGARVEDTSVVHLQTTIASRAYQR